MKVFLSATVRYFPACSLTCESSTLHSPVQLGVLCWLDTDNFPWTGEVRPSTSLSNTRNITEPQVLPTSVWCYGVAVKKRRGLVWSEGEQCSHSSHATTGSRC